ncbi:MAG: NAD(P)-binding domain-containing protein [Acidobacteria bacterium]|nr:NAD(P)-binding domain-containing protein [Acidobacteriota bacterium]
MARVAIIGVGAVGARLARQLVSTDADEVVLRDVDRARLDMVAQSLGERARIDTAELTAPIDADVVVLAGRARVHADQADALLAGGAPIVAVGDDLSDVRGLLALDRRARQLGTTVVVGAGFAPGLTCVLAAHGARRFDLVEEIHIAKAGTGGPACARQHHRSLGRAAVDWRDGAWETRPGGSGRELCWFPEPIGAQDCYRAELPDPLLLVPAFAGLRRATSRMAATRRDRLTARLPMLWPTHPEGGPGAVRVELRGQRDGVRDTLVLGAMDRPAVAAGAVAAVAVRFAIEGRLHRSGAAGLAELVDPLAFLQDLAARGVRAATFDGAVASRSGG